MRTKFVQTLADYQLELNGLRTRYEFEKAKPLDEADDEFIDVTGDDSGELQMKIVPNLEQPPSKIYYDNIEKESSDGGFFDRDDLEDEDEKNDLIIDCKLNTGETGEKKTDRESCGRTGEKPQAPTTEPELVFNFTVVDTHLVYNEPTGAGSKLLNPKDLRCGVGDRPVVSISIPPPPSKAPPPMQHKTSLLAAKLKEVRIHPYARSTQKLSNATRRIVEYPSSLRTPVQSYGFHRIQQSHEPIGSRFRPSAFSPPAKAHVVPQSVHLKPSMRPSKSNGLPHPSMVRKPPKKLYRLLAQNPQTQMPYPPFSPNAPQYQPPLEKHQAPPPERLLLPIPPVPKLPRYLPPQFGFGSSALHNIYDPEQPLDFSKNSLLSQYESMLKCSQQQQIRQGYSILRSMPLPAPPQPPKCAHRPIVVPLKQHPTLYRIHRPPPPILRSPNEPGGNPYPTKPPAPAEPLPLPLPNTALVSESFRQHAQAAIEKFFTIRQNQICDALRLFATERISLDELFRRLDRYQIRFGSRDYHDLAAAMAQRHGYRIRSGPLPHPASYRFKEPPQSFVEYFRNVKDSLRPHVPEETLGIYRIVIGSLLEQFRDSLEHFLSRCLH